MQKQETKGISKDMTIVDVFQKYPHRVTKLSQIMTSHGLHCIGCHVSAYETLEQGVQGHGFSEEKLKTMLKELNEVVKNEKE